MFKIDNFYFYFSLKRKCFDNFLGRGREKQRTIFIFRFFCYLNFDSIEMGPEQRLVAKGRPFLLNHVVMIREAEVSRVVLVLTVWSALFQYRLHIRKQYSAEAISSQLHNFTRSPFRWHSLHWLQINSINDTHSNHDIDSRHCWWMHFQGHACDVRIVMTVPTWFCSNENKTHNFCKNVF